MKNAEYNPMIGDTPATNAKAIASGRKRGQVQFIAFSVSPVSVALPPAQESKPFSQPNHDCHKEFLEYNFVAKPPVRLPTLVR